MAANLYRCGRGGYCWWMSLVIERGGAGWISARDGDGPVAYLRCERDQDGRAVVGRLFLRGDGPITAATLRAIPLGRIEALLNDPQVPLRRSGDAGLIDFDPPVG